MKIRKPIQQGTALVPCRTKGENSFKKIGSIAGKVLLALLLILLLLAVFGTAAHAAGLVDDTVDAANEYSKYPLDNYQLDFYVDSGWDWLPWNWLDGIGKQVMYGLYAITNFIWTISLYLSNATGYLIQEAYSCYNSDRYRKTYYIVVQFLLCVSKIKLCFRNGNKKNRYLAAYFPCVKNHIIFSRRRFNKSRRLFLPEI